MRLRRVDLPVPLFSLISACDVEQILSRLSFVQRWRPSSPYCTRREHARRKNENPDALDAQIEILV